MPGAAECAAKYRLSASTAAIFARAACSYWPTRRYTCAGMWTTWPAPGMSLGRRSPHRRAPSGGAAASPAASQSRPRRVRAREGGVGGGRCLDGGKEEVARARVGVLALDRAFEHSNELQRSRLRLAVTGPLVPPPPIEHRGGKHHLRVM